jgi:hypothetical protein
VEAEPITVESDEESAFSPPTDTIPPPTADPPDQTSGTFRRQRGHKSRGPRIFKPRLENRPLTGEEFKVSRRLVNLLRYQKKRPGGSYFHIEKDEDGFVELLFLQPRFIRKLEAKSLFRVLADPSKSQGGKTRFVVRGSLKRRDLAIKLRDSLPRPPHQAKKRKREGHVCSSSDSGEVRNKFRAYRESFPEQGSASASSSVAPPPQLTSPIRQGSASAPPAAKSAPVPVAQAAPSVLRRPRQSVAAPTAVTTGAPGGVWDESA